MKLTFLGAAREVTGSSYLLEADGVRFLVDCGMFQGGRETRAKNQRAFSFDPRSIDFVILTHAHIDHSGLLPRLIALGFKGKVHTTRATCDLLAVMLPDSAHIQEKEAEYANLNRFRQRMAKREAAQGLPARDIAPLYTVAQAQAALRQLNPVDYDLEIAPHPQVRCTFRDAGHILGSAIVEVWVGEGAQRRKIVFSGDLGQPARPLLRDPTPIFDADYLLIESTYGNRAHKSMEATQDELVEAITDTIERKGGNVIVPAFAVGRTQDMLYLLADLTRQGRLPKLTVFVDSPMATAATEITYKHMALLDAETHALMGRHGGAAHFRKLNFVEDVEESKSLDRIKGGAVIISASGMCEAGRIKFHLRANLPRRESSVLITGFQAAGTFGRRLVDGAKRVRLLGEDIQVRAGLYTLGGLSAHADRAALLSWLGHFRSTREGHAGGAPATTQRPFRSTREGYAGGNPAATQRPFRSQPRQVFVVHGEDAVATGFAADLKAQFGWDAMAPMPGDRVELE